jgi:hypothetical protein
MIRKRSCGTAAKAGGNRENKHFPKSWKTPGYSQVTWQWLPVERESAYSRQALLSKE